MKICHVLTHNPAGTGGIETVVAELSKNNDVRWIGRGGPASIIGGFILALKLRFSDYDVIHIHDNAGYWCTRLGGKKTVYTVHGMWEDYFDANKPKGFSGKIAASILVRMQRRLIKKSTKTVCITQKTADKVRKKYSKDTSVVHNGVDTKIFFPKKRPKKFDYIWVGTNPQSKRLNDALKVAESQEKSILVVGTHGKDTRRIKFIQNSTRNGMPKIYNSASTFIYFNKQPDYSLAMLESMACGLNIITTEGIMTEITGNFSRKGFVKLDGEKFPVAYLNGSKARKLAKTKMDWSISRLMYSKIYRSCTE